MDDIEIVEHLAALNLLEEIEEADLLPRHVNDGLDPFVDLSENAFIGIYRLSKALAKMVVEMVTPYMKVPSTSRGLTIERKVLTALRFFASESYQMDIGLNQYAAISQSSVSQCISEVTNALCKPHIFDEIVRFPNSFEELNSVQRGFYNKYGIRQNVVGIIDCTHVAIFPPSMLNTTYPEHIYVNRKGYHSINTQLICDVDLRILNVCAKYLGSVHDSHIWNQSAVKQLMTDLHNNGHKSYVLYRDSGYALHPWMMTPFLNPDDGTPEAAFNNTFCKIRSTIERCNGVLKMRFRCLLKHRVLHYAPSKASSIINSCVLLHNLCIREKIPIINIGTMDDDDDDDDVGFDFGIIPFNNDNPSNRNSELIDGRNVRQHIVDTYYT